MVEAHQRVSRDRPCPVCGKPDWCLFTPDGASIWCQRCDSWGGQPAILHTDAGWLFRLTEQRPPELPARRPREPRASTLPREVLDAAYRELAGMCGLRPAAHADLIEKRSFPEALQTGLYFSLPRAGHENRDMTARLVAKYGAEVITAVPGFTHRDGMLGFRSVRAGREDYAVMGLDEDSYAFWGYSRRLPYDPWLLPRLRFQPCRCWHRLSNQRRQCQWAYLEMVP